MTDGRSVQAMEGPRAEQRRLVAQLIFNLLRVKAQVEEGSWTTCGLCGDVRELMSSIDCRVFKEVLEQFHALGLIQSQPSAEQAGVVSTSKWVTASGYAATLGGGGGGSGGFPPKEGAPPPGPRRYPEVLAHPVLFALSPEDFESTLAQMLPE